MAQLAELDIKVSTQPLREQLAMLERGELDLGAMVIAPDSQLMLQAVHDRKLQIVDIAAADALAAVFPPRAGNDQGGQLRSRPPVATNGQADHRDRHAGHRQRLRPRIRYARRDHGIERVFPNFVSVNRERAESDRIGVCLGSARLLRRQGPDTVGEYVPWFIDIMPTARWVQLAFAFSLLFGAQAAWHRFRLWRVDAGRVEIEDEVSACSHLASR